MARKSNSLNAVYTAAKDDGACLKKEFEIPISLIQCEWDENIRPKNDEHIERWKHTMRTGDYVPAVLVELRDGVPYVIEGFHRYTAKEQLVEQEGADDLLLVKEWKGSEDEKLITMHASTSGLPLTYLEDAEVILRIKAAGDYTPESLGQRMGVSRTTINNKILLAEASEEIKQLVREEKVSATVAIEAIIKHGDKALNHLEHMLKKAEAKGKPSKVRGSGAKAFSQAKLRTIAELLLVGFDYEKFVENYDELGDGDVDQEITLDKADMYELVMLLEEYSEYKENNK